MKIQNAYFDAVFVGGGLASASILYEVIMLLSKMDLPNRMNFAICDPDDLIGGGVAYGFRSGDDARLITSLDDFLPGCWRKDFIEWIQNNCHDICIRLDNTGGSSVALCQELRLSIVSGEIGSLFLPRFLFGWYFSQKIKKVIESNFQKVNVSHFRAVVEDVERHDSLKDFSFHLACSNNISLQTKQLVLGVGSLPAKRIKFLGKRENRRSLVINELYSSSLENNFEKIAGLVSCTKKVNVVIAGDNATALEFNYKAQNHLGDVFDSVNVHVISPRGRLPTAVQPHEANFEAVSLDRLLKSGDFLAADTILQAFNDDLSLADAKRFGISETFPLFTQKVGSLVAKMDKTEKLKFANYHGHEIGRLQRRCGSLYEEAWRYPRSNYRLSLLSGRVIKALVQPNGRLEIMFCGSCGEPKSIKDIDVFVNCMGPSRIDDLDSGNFISKVMASCSLKPTSSGLGVQVDDRFSASRGVWINGPLLSGNVVKDHCIWHAEHCGRILSFAAEIAPMLLEELVDPAL